MMKKPKKKETLSNDGSCINFGLALNDSEDIEIQDISELDGRYDPLSILIEKEVVSPDDLLDRIGLGVNFFYSVTQFKINEKSHYNDTIVMEKGVGELYKKGGKFFLKRETSLGIWTAYKDILNVESKLVRTKPPLYPMQKFTNEDYLLVSSFCPDNFHECLVHPYSVMCSTSPFTPVPVELQNNTLLGRKDGIIQSIDKSELREILTDEEIISALSEKKTPLILSSKALDLSVVDSVVSTHVIQAKPYYSNNIRPKGSIKGSIIYNDDEGCFEGYDGSRWRKLKWGD